MANRDDVILGLKCHAGPTCDADSKTCPYIRKDNCSLELSKDALELFEPVEPVYRKPKYRFLTVPFCGYCGHELKAIWNACPHCGRMVKRGE
jgi:hypothetical protein